MKEKVKLSLLIDGDELDSLMADRYVLKNVLGEVYALESDIEKILNEVFADE